jgi:methylase of polypeptide subunit release factors
MFGTSKQENKFISNIGLLIKDLSGPNYFTNAFSNIGIKSLIILSNVFRADRSYLAAYLAKILFLRKDLYKKKSVLDLGCGCGLQGLVCALNGAKNVHFSDINPAAIKNALLNVILLDVKNCSFSCGNLFENIPSNSFFDLIIFVPPSISGIARKVSDLALLRNDKDLLRFYKSFPRFLKKNGKLIMPGSTRFNDELSPMNVCKRYGYNLTIIHKEKEESGHYKFTLEIKV